MEIKDLHWWDMKPEPTEGCEIKCPECNEWTKYTEWTETEVGCEDCGSHAAIRCPKCDEDFDHVGSREFEVREAEKV